MASSDVIVRPTGAPCKRSRLIRIEFGAFRNAEGVRRGETGIDSYAANYCQERVGVGVDEARRHHATGQFQHPFGGMAALRCSMSQLRNLAVADADRTVTWRRPSQCLNAIGRPSAIRALALCRLCFAFDRRAALRRVAIGIKRPLAPARQRSHRWPFVRRLLGLSQHCDHGV